MLIPVLDRRHYSQALKQPKVPGWNPTTHLAKIHFPGAGELPAWVKVDPAIKPFVGNEVVGWLLARELDIPAAPQAALLVEEVAWFKQTLGERYAGDALLPTDGLAIAWCTADLGSMPIRSEAPFDDWNLLAFLRTEEGAQIAAFDHWLGNEDRNTGNLLRLYGGRYAVIDHGILFCYLDWRSGPINPDCRSLLLNQARLLRRQGRLTAKEYRMLAASMAEFGRRHECAAGNAYAAIHANISEIYDINAAENVLSCISGRSHDRWIADEVGELI